MKRSLVFYWRTLIFFCGVVFVLFAWAIIPVLLGLFFHIPLFLKIFLGVVIFVLEVSTCRAYARAMEEAERDTIYN